MEAGTRPRAKIRTLRATGVAAMALAGYLALADWEDLVAPISGGCGLFHRDEVRSATDVAAGRIDRQPQPTTIGVLIATPAQKVGPWTARLAPAETTVWQ